MDKATQHLLEKLTEALNETNTLLRRATSPERQHYTQANHPEDAASKEGDSAPGKVALGSHADPPPKTKQQAKEAWYKTFKGWKPVLEVIAVVSAVVYAFLTYRQWHDANRNFTAEERPYIFSTNLSFPAVLPSNVLKTDVSYSNFGKSPAFHVKVVSTILDGNQSYEDWFKPLEGKDLEDTESGRSQHRPGGSMPERVVVPSEPAGQTVVGIGGPTDPMTSYSVVMRVQYQDLGGTFYWNDVCWMHLQNAPVMLRCLTRNN